jgi:hypothetical protein
LALICHDRIDGRAGGRAQITQICDHRGRRRHALAIAPNTAGRRAVIKNSPHRWQS